MRMFKRVAFFSLILFLPLSLKAEEVKFFGPRGPTSMVLTLDQCIRRALTYNLELQVADYSIQSIEEKKKENERIGHPVVEYEYDLAPIPKDISNAVNSFFTGDLTVFNKFKLGIGVPIHTFGKVKLGKEIADAGIQSEKEKKNQKKAEIVFRIKQLYHGILLAREVNHLLESARDEIAKEVDKREAEGGTDPTELLKLKIFKEDVDKRIEEGNKREILAKEALRNQLGVDEGVQFDLAADKLRMVETPVKDFKSYRDEAVAHRSDLKQLGLGYTVREKQLALEKRLLTPNLGVGSFFEIGRAPGVTGVTTTDDFSDPFNFTRAGVGLRLNGQFDFHASRAKIHQAESELYKVDVQRDLAEDAVELEVKEAYLNVQNTKLEIERAEEAGRLSRQLVFLTQSNFDIGLAESKDLVDAVSSFLEARGRYFEAVFNYNVALAGLEQKVGRIPE